MTQSSLHMVAVGDPDGIYQILVEAYDGLTPEQSRLVDARLILLLANHIGEPAVLTEAVVAARAGIAAPADR